MTLTGEPTAQFSELEPEDLEDYRPLNRSSLVAFVLALASPMALTHPAMGLIPALGIVFALVGLRQFRDPEVKHTGRILAVLALTVCLFFLSWAIAREASRKRNLYTRSRIFAESWFNLLQAGKVNEAHQLTILEGRRAARGQSLETYYQRRESKREEIRQQQVDPAAPGDAAQMMEMMEPSPYDQLQEFLNRPLMKRITEFGPNAQFIWRANVRAGPAGHNTERIELLYDVRGRSNQQTLTIPFTITLERTTISGKADWRVETVQELQRGI